MTNGQLPDLNASNSQIVAENIRATGPIYVSAMLEDLRLYQVADQLVAAFQNGMLPINKSSSRNLYQYWRDAPQRLTTSDRKNLYSRVLGIPGGDAAVVPNRDFNDLWIRFVASVSEFNRQSSNEAAAVTRVAGRELAQNLSQHGYGIVYFAATELQNQIKQIMKLLSDSEIQKAYGAHDVWQVVEQIANLDLGGATNTTRYRTLASTGAAIIAWLSKNARKFSISSRGPLLSFNKPVINKNVLGSIFQNSPTDGLLVNACEQWLAVTGTPDGSIDDLSQPNR